LLQRREAARGRRLVVCRTGLLGARRRRHFLLGEASFRLLLPPPAHRVERDEEAAVIVDRRDLGGGIAFAGEEAAQLLDDRLPAARVVPLGEASGDRRVLALTPLGEGRLGRLRPMRPRRFDRSRAFLVSRPFPGEERRVLAAHPLPVEACTFNHDRVALGLGDESIELSRQAGALAVELLLQTRQLLVAGGQEALPFRLSSRDHGLELRRKLLEEPLLLLRPADRRRRVLWTGIGLAAGPFVLGFQRGEDLLCPFVEV